MGCPSPCSAPTPRRGQQPSSWDFQLHKGLKPHLDTAVFKPGTPIRGWGEVGGGSTPGWSGVPQ